MIFLSNQSILEYAHVCEKEKEGAFSAVPSQIRRPKRPTISTAAPAQGHRSLLSARCQTDKAFPHYSHQTTTTHVCLTKLKPQGATSQTMQTYNILLACIYI